MSAKSFLVSVFVFFCFSVEAGPLSPGNWYSGAPHRVRLHNEGRSALAERIYMIRTAQKSLRLRTFLFANDFVGNLLLSEIRKRKKEVPSLDVRILLDYWGMGEGPVIPSNLLNDLLLEKIHVRYYNKAMKVRVVNFNQRDHGKMIVGDCDQFIVGGRNIEDGYFGLSKSMNFLDRDIWIQGPSGVSACESFDLFWNNPIATPHRIGMGPSSAVRKASPWEVPLRAQLESELEKLEKLTFATNSGISLIVDLPGSGNSSRILSRYLEGFIMGSETSMDMETPTFIPKASLQGAIDSVLNRDKFRLTVLTNTPASMKVAPRVDGMIVSALSTWFRDLANVPGLKVHLFGETASGGNPFVDSPEWSLHSKTYIRDQRDVMVSSYNFSPRSQNYSSELAVVLWNQPALSRAISEDIVWRSNRYGTPLDSFVKRIPLSVPPTTAGSRAMRTLQDVWEGYAHKWTTDLL